ncbi:MAG TPA: universal stress protein [Pyrinomonadaceae bacterium]|nr:universal stress protein [Pyrinomonadaceae bacterium]
MRILLAIDGSPFGDAAVSEVASRPWPTTSEVKVVTAFQVPLIPTPEVWAISDEYLPALERIAREQSQSIVDAAVTTLTNGLDQSITVSGEVLLGLPREAILEEAERWKADLIVLGSHGYGAWRGFLLGSVSRAVVAQAKCSVEVVHRRQGHEQARAA